MCGIFGIWQFDQPVNLENVERATFSLRHRGPDDEGYLLINTRKNDVIACSGQETHVGINLPPVKECYQDQFDLALGFRRLAILDLSPAGHQPMASGDGRFWIIFNGEIYNFLELRTELSRYGYRFCTNTDTEVILAAYQHWGLECLDRFNGMWAFALWDHHKQHLFLARDRFGIKPLYYVYSPHRQFVFASEIKALVGQHGRPFRPDTHTIYRYLVEGTSPSFKEEQTFFTDVQLLPPGHWMLIEPDGLTKQKYWSLQIVSQVTSSQKASVAVDQFRELFEDAIRLRLRADVPVGTCLSGGVDSSSIVAVMNQLLLQGGLPAGQIGQQLKTFSAVYRTAGRYNEIEYIEQLLQTVNAEGNLVYPSGEDLRGEINELVWHQDEPFLSTSIFAQWCVMRLARERGVIVLLDGQGADETWAGYRPYVPYLSSLLRQAGVSQALKETRTISSQTGMSGTTLMLRALFHQLPGAWVEGVQRHMINAQTDVSFLNKDFIVSERDGTLADWRSWRDHRDLDSCLQHHLETRLLELLRYEDRNSMAFGVETRLPFLDYRLVQFAFNAGAPWRIHQGWTKWLVRRAMADIVPSEVIWRKDKVGFETPEAEWIQQWLQSDPDLLNQDALSQEYLNLDVVREKLHPWMQAGGNKRTAVWRWVNLEIWLRRWSQV